MDEGKDRKGRYDVAATDVARAVGAHNLSENACQRWLLEPTRLRIEETLECANGQ